MTGADFSSASIRLARELASDLGFADARFIESNVYQLPARLGDEFDIVYTSRGVLGWLLGHALGGSASIEAGLCAFAIRHGLIPPTINLTDPDPECDLDYVPLTARRAELDVVLSNSFGFGGMNTTLVLRRYDG